MPGSLIRWWEKDGTFICNIFIEHTKIIEPNRTITDVVIFDGASNVYIGGELMKTHCPKLTLMHGVEHTVSLFLNDVYKIPFVNQRITAHKEIHNLFGSSIYHKTSYIFKSKSYEFRDSNIGLFSGNDNRMAGYFIGMHRDLRTRKALLATFSSVNSTLYH